MQPFITLTGVAVPLLRDDVNTDQITPINRDIDPDWAALLFANTRKRADGSDDPDFPLNKPQFRRPSILVAGRNFGCGSSREGAVWAMLATGIRCIVARSFADIYRENCLQNGLLPIELNAADAEAFAARVIAADGVASFTVDLEAQGRAHDHFRDACLLVREDGAERKIVAQRGAQGRVVPRRRMDGPRA